MRTKSVFIALVLVLASGVWPAQGRDMNDRSLGVEMNRERAETRIERLRRDKQEKENAASSRNERSAPRDRQPARDPQLLNRN